MGFILLASQYRYGDMHRMGPAMFPTLVGALLALLGAVIARARVRVAGRAGAALSRPAARSYRSFAIVTVRRRMLRWLGLVTAVAVLVLVGAFAARDVRPLENAVLAAVMVLFSVAVFVWLLGLPLPLWPDS